MGARYAHPARASTPLTVGGNWCTVLADAVLVCLCDPAQAVVVFGGNHLCGRSVKGCRRGMKGGAEEEHWESKRHMPHIPMSSKYPQGYHKDAPPT